MSDSRQLEREAEQARHELERTLFELRARVSPGQLVDQAIDYARESGGGEFARNLGRQAAENPVPVCLIGAGIAWLMLGKGTKGSGHIGPLARESRFSAGNTVENSRQHASEFIHGSEAQIRDLGADTRGQVRNIQEKTGSMAQAAAERLGETALSASDRIQEGVRNVADQVRNAASAVADKAGSAYEAGRGHANAAAETLSGATGAAASLGRSTVGMSASLVRRCADEPLVLAGIGLAIGAAIGVALPPTETENRLVGDTSARVKDEVAGFAGEQYEKGKTAVKEAVRDVVQEAGDRVRSASGNGRDPHLDIASKSRESSHGAAGEEQQSS